MRQLTQQITGWAIKGDGFEGANANISASPVGHEFGHAPRAAALSARKIKSLIGAVIIVLALLVTQLALSPSAQARDIVAYKVRPGDTLSKLAKDYFLRPSHAKKVQRINRIRDPRKIPVGKTLYIPKPYLRYTELNARVQAYRGRVIMSRRGDATPAQISKGMKLGEGDVVSTAPAGFVTLAIDGGARTSLPSSSTVRIDRLRRYNINGEVERIFSLYKGRTDVEAGELGKEKGSKTLQIRGPNATAAIRGTGFTLSALPEKTGISVFHGVVGSSQMDTTPLDVSLAASERNAMRAVRDERKRARAGAAAPIDEGDATDPSDDGSVALDAGFGIIGDESGLSDRVQLLKAPEEADNRPLRTEATVRFAVKPLQGAKLYRYKVADDAAMIGTITEKDRTEPFINLDGLADGQYFVRVSGNDEFGLEGMGRTYGFRKIYATVDAGSAEQGPAGVKFAWTYTGNGSAVRFVLADNKDLTMPLLDRPGLLGESLTLANLPPGTYYWAVERQLWVNGKPEVISSGPQELVMTDP